jgi:hypothetical protein
MPTRCNRRFLLQILLLAQHVSGTTMPIIRSSRVLYRWLLPVVLGAPYHADNLTTKAPNPTGSNHLYNTLELLMMGIMVTETCWASNKIYNKNHPLHIVGILFPHIKFTTFSLFPKVKRVDCNNSYFINNILQLIRQESCKDYLFKLSVKKV